ncbi:lipid A export permease/ATP-binding protein MsbA [Azovibrio restrictus]|uniref:lipid A export permease/ATP-binding protein MsbA n=1 Tax=Azovibrio restrictus TaxID=146938 RepID=UPI0026EE2C85|nr:lipid A export permease/ATP-binding protein MsbA [Azovibrio restrictus]MDD3483745.1 lipid A export permease/ATP-binding protein MsbA [Azovibrio restrictus]
MGKSADMEGKELYLRLLTYVRPYWKAFALGVVCMALAALAEPAFPAFLKYLLDDGFAAHQDSLDFLIYPTALFLIFLVRAIIGFIADYLMHWVSQNVIAELRQAMFAQMIRLPTRYFGDNASGRIMSRISYDVTGVAGASTTALTTVIKDGCAVIGLMGWLLWLNWKLTLITLITVPFIAFAVKTLSRRIRTFARGIQDAQGNITQILQEAIEGAKIIKIFGGQRYETERFNHAVREQRGLQMRSIVANAALGPITHFFTALALAIVMAIALYQASQGKATVGDFVSFITAMLMVLAPLRRVMDVNATIQKGLVAAESVFHLIDQAGETDNGTQSLGKARGEVCFAHVSFTYPGAERPALTDLSFSIRPGERVALVGPSGSGKTTAANLLPRFYDLEQGHISVDGYDIRDVRLESLRDNIALVSQEVVLFNDTIAANIAYGGPAAVSHADIEAAALAAHALEFIQRLPQGFDTLVGEHGVKLSGGQRQRLAIARALLKNAPILILDEATSALDTESERQVQAALDELMTGRATLIIAHRLTTIEQADRIIVLTQGEKAEEGTHAELLAHQGIYARLYNLQQDAPGAD